MHKTYKIFILFVLIIFSMTGCSYFSTEKQSDGNIKLTISAAISLTDALEEITNNFSKEHDVSFQFNFAGSGTLARQIEQGAPVDLFISADPKWIDDLEKKDLIDNKTRVDVVKNELVLIKEKNTKTNINKVEDLIKTKEQIAIGNPETVPAGKYTKTALENLNLWKELENHFIQAKDVRQVLTYVESKNTHLGFVYKSDAQMSSEIEIIDYIDDALHELIVYPAAIVNSSEHKEMAEKFLSYLQTDEAKNIFEKYGFNEI